MQVRRDAPADVQAENDVSVASDSSDPDSAFDDSESGSSDPDSAFDDSESDSDFDDRFGTGDDLESDESQQRLEQLIRRLVTKKVPVGESNGDCAICLESMQEGQSIRQLPCKHAYHAHCIDGWLKKKVTCVTCPQCRAGISSGLARGEHPGNVIDLS
jgi:hypothetical protein